MNKALQDVSNILRGFSMPFSCQCMYDRETQKIVSQSGTTDIGEREFGEAEHATLVKYSRCSSKGGHTSELRTYFCILREMSFAFIAEEVF